MKNFLKKIFKLISKSILDNKGRVSSAIITSYFILGAILTATGVFVGIDVVNSIIAWNTKGFYEVPSNHIFLYGMTLAHHLTLLGINKHAESKVQISAHENKIKPEEEI